VTILHRAGRNVVVLQESSERRPWKSVAQAFAPVVPQFGSLVSAQRRCDWSLRLEESFRMPERTDAEIVAKYTSIHAIASDFLAAATQAAMLVVNERGESTA
jgi:hypothetical protein